METFLTFLLCFLLTSALGKDVANIREKGSSVNITASKTTSATDIGMSLNLSSTPHSDISLPSKESVNSTVLGTHNGREHVIEPSATKSVIKPVEKANMTTTKSEPVKTNTNSSNIVPSQPDPKKTSVPKKGVSFPVSEAPILNTTANASNILNKKNLNVTGISLPKTNSSSNATVVYKKPLVTESDSDYVDIKNSEVSKENTIAVDQIDPSIVDKKSNRSDYIVPIVGVILSVPLVAILISYVYKRGTDWWQHRNYKRMDFLIEGMYHN